MNTDQPGARRSAVWQILFGVFIGLLAAGGLWLAASPPRGAPVRLLPPPTLPPLSVHVTGAVLHPGVVSLPPGSRVGDAIQAAGGLLPEADGEALNLAALLQDGIRLRVPRIGEALDPAETGASAGSLPLININTASKEELESLPGIGPVMAQAIVDHRQEHGLFTSPEALLDVEGIGPGTYEQIKDRITTGG
jgi:competence protein ComEA